MPRSVEGRPPRARLAGCASAYAWFFGGGSLLALGLIVFTHAGSVGTSSAGIFCWNTADGQRHTGWLMDYTGATGFVLAASEACLLLLALVGSCVRGITIRRVSLVYLVAWAALWLAGASRQMLAMQTWDTLAYTLGSALAVVTTYARARGRWSANVEAAPDRSPRAS